jgi:hypothetical protein
MQTRYIAGMPSRSSELKPLDLRKVGALNTKKCNDASSSSNVLPAFVRVSTYQSDSVASWELAGQKAKQATQAFKDLLFRRGDNSSLHKKSADPQVSTPTTSRTLFPHRLQSQEDSSDTFSTDTKRFIRSLLPQLQGAILPQSQGDSSDVGGIHRALCQSQEDSSDVGGIHRALCLQSQEDSSDVGGIHRALCLQSQEDSSDGKEIHQEDTMNLFAYLSTEISLSKQELQLPCPFSDRDTYFEGEDDRDGRPYLCSLPHEDGHWGGGGEDHNSYGDDLHEIMCDESIKKMIVEVAEAPDEVAEAPDEHPPRSEFPDRKRRRSDNKKHTRNNFEEGFADGKHDHGIYQKHNHLIHYNGELLYLIVLMMHTSTIVSCCTSTIASFTLVVTTRRCMMFLIH